MVDRKHVFRDLRPYVCTLEDCIEPEITYATRSALTEHEIGKHRVNPTYRCRKCDNVEFSSYELLNEHFETHDDLDVSNPFGFGRLGRIQATIVR